MQLTLVSSFAALFSLILTVLAERQEAFKNHGVAGRQSLFRIASSPAAPKLGNSTFEQLIDHSDPSLGTFSQFYYWSTEFWGGPGYPVILNTPGEANVTGYDSYLTSNRTTGVIAEQLQAAVIVLEHRYWGYSSPFADLSTKNMQYLTLNNSIRDLTYFAEQNRPSWDPQGLSRASKAPWVLTGGSYPGALAAWTAALDPGTFWAYYASSAPVQAISDLWTYFSPVQLGMPKNCSSDLNLVIDHIDEVFNTGSEKEQTDLKASFGLAGLENDDFGATLENGPWLWQGNQFYTGYSGFFRFCDAVENADLGERPGAEGVGLEKALAGYARWINSTLLPGFCESYDYPEFVGENNTACLNTHNADSPLYTDRTLSNRVDRQWNWFLCNEPFGYWQTGAPKGQSTLVSRLVDVDYWTRQCEYYFPEEDGYTYGLAKGATEDGVNALTQGWDFTAKRLLYVNGEFDPWRDSGVSSNYRPEGPLQSTPDTPVIVVPGGFHTSDLVSANNGNANAGAKKAIAAAVKVIVDWVNEHPTRQPDHYLQRD